MFRYNINYIYTIYFSFFFFFYHFLLTVYISYYISYVLVDASSAANWNNIPSAGLLSCRNMA